MMIIPESDQGQCHCMILKISHLPQSKFFGSNYNKGLTLSMKIIFSMILQHNGNKQDYLYHAFVTRDKGFGYLRQLLFHLGCLLHYDLNSILDNSHFILHC